MSHVRAQIREALRGAISALASISSDRVIYDTDEIPEDTSREWVEVGIGNEDISHDTLGSSSAGAILRRELVVNTDIYYRARTEALLLAEAIAADVETAIATSSALLALCQSWFLAGIEVVRDDEGEQPLVRLRLQWLVTYATNERDPTVAIP